jgi:type IX secretion system PorP/SprF family membrane protein
MVTVSNLLKKTTIFLILFITIHNLSAQQIPMSNNYYINKFVYNPSQIGEYSFTQTFFQARKQWMGIEGAPETYLFSIDGNVNSEKVGVGAMFYSDITGIIGRTAGYGAYRYKIRFFDEHTIDLGISAGFLQNKIYFDKIRSDDPMEESILANEEMKTTFDANFGINYKFRNLQVGIASFQLFNSNVYYQTSDNLQSVNYKLIRHFIGSISYKQQLSRDFRIDPQFVVKDVQGMPLQFDIGTYLNYRELAWFGVNYQHKYSLSLSLGGVLHDRYVINYSYDIPTGNIANYTSGGHEFLIGIRFFKKSDKGAISGGNRNDLNHLKRISQEQYEEIERLTDENKQLKQKVDSTYEDVQYQKEEIEKLKEIYKQDEGQISQVIEKYQISIDELDALDFSESSDEKQFYVVLGAYLSIDDAKLFQKVMEREIGLDTKVVQREDGKYFFVYTRDFNKDVESKKAIKKEFRLLQRLNLDEYINGNDWIYNAKQNE